MNINWNKKKFFKEIKNYNINDFRFNLGLCKQS